MEKYGRLTVIEKYPQLWRCKCDCSSICDKSPLSVTTWPDMSSCGCLMREAADRIKEGKRQRTKAEEREIQERREKRTAAAMERKNERLAKLKARKDREAQEAASRASRAHNAATREQYPHLYSTWTAMHCRCYNRLGSGYRRYGARGIGICDRWHRNNTSGFANFVADMGDRPKGLSIDRIDNNAHYAPENCCWATFSEQIQNRGYDDLR